jgi:hypothetical protein
VAAHQAAVEKTITSREMTTGMIAIREFAVMQLAVKQIRAVEQSKAAERHFIRGEGVI